MDRGYHRRRIFEFADPTDLTAFVQRNLPSTLTGATKALSFDDQGHLWIADTTGAEVFEFADPTDLTAFIRRNLPSALTVPWAYPLMPGAPVDRRQGQRRRSI